MVLPLFVSLSDFLFPQVQCLDNCPVTFDINHLQVIELLAALAYQTEQCPLGAEVVPVTFQMFRKVVDTVGKQRDLSLGGTGIGIRLSVLPKKLLLFLCC